MRCDLIKNSIHINFIASKIELKITRDFIDYLVNSIA